MFGGERTGDDCSGYGESTMEFPLRMFPVGKEPIRERVNAYHEHSRIQSLLDAMSEEEIRLNNTVFGPFLDKIGKMAYSLDRKMAYSLNNYLIPGYAKALDGKSDSVKRKLDGETEELAIPLAKTVSDKAANNYVIFGYAKALDGKTNSVTKGVDD